MDHLHNPARLPGESQADYDARRAKSKAHTDRITCKSLGNQRSIPSARERLRNSQRANGRGPRAVYGLGLLEPQRQRNLKRIADTAPQHLRDDYGTFTLVGARHHGHRGPLQHMRSDHPALGAMSVQAGRRKWLAGISAQRGF